MVEKSIRYKRAQGDNLGNIAEKHRVTVKQLKAWNNLRSDRINAGGPC
jgi:membrane-bound lytic murein transglycosylase D